LENYKKRIPSWNRYVEAGSFLPNLPVTQRIRQKTVESKLINLASGELSEDLFPINTLREITSTRSFIGSLGYDHPQRDKILRETIVKHVKQFRKIETNSSSIFFNHICKLSRYKSFARYIHPFYSFPPTFQLNFVKIY